MSVRSGMFSQFHPIVYIIFLGNVLTNLANGMIAPFFAIYLARHTDWSLTMIGLVVGSASLAGMMGGFFGGTVSDRFGRKKVMLGSLYVSAFLYFVFSLTGNAFFLFILTILKGFCGAFYEPSSKALMGDVTVPKKRLRAFSIRYMAANAGFGMGPILGAVCGAKGSSPLPFLLAAIIFLAYGLLLHTLLNRFPMKAENGDARERITMRSALKVVRYDSILLLFLVGGIFATTVHGQFSAILAQYFDYEFTEGVDFLGTLWTVHALVIILLSVPLTRWVEKQPPLKAIIVGTLLFAAGVIGFWLSYSLPTLLVSMVIFTAGEIFIVPAEYAMIDRITPEGMRGTYYGSASFTSLGSFLGPVLSGFLLLHYGGNVMFGTLAIIVLLSIFFFHRGQAIQSRISVHEGFPLKAAP